MDDLHKEIKGGPISEDVAVKVNSSPYASKVATGTNSTVKPDEKNNTNSTNTTTPASATKVTVNSTQIATTVNASSASDTLDPFSELNQKPFVNLAQRPKAVSLIQIDQQVISDQGMLDKFQIDQALSEETFFEDVVGEPTNLVETNSTKMNEQGFEEKITLIKGDNQKLEFAESFVELDDDDKVQELPKESDVMLENGPMDAPEEQGLEQTTQENTEDQETPEE